MKPINAMLLTALICAPCVCPKMIARADVTAGPSAILGPFVGQGAVRDEANLRPHPIEYYGTDLGFSYEHRGRLHFIFGDTMGVEAGDPIERSNGGKFDDSYGSLDLSRWNDPGHFTPGHLPPVLLGQNPGSAEAAAIDIGQPLEEFKTPVGAFSDGTHEFGVFFTYKPRGCSVDRECPLHTTCDPGLGEAGAHWKETAGLTFACLDNSPGCRNDTLPGVRSRRAQPSGLCVDHTSSNANATPRGRIDATVVQLLIGQRDHDTPKRYKVLHEWYTRKFMNATFRTVRDFNEPGAGADVPDYHWIYAPSPNGKLFVWGRPHFVGVNALHRTLSAYFAYADIASVSRGEWQPRYFAGLDGTGRPRFTTDESEAQPMDLDGTRPGVQADDPTDVVDQVSVAWVPELSKWVMLYGGGLTTLPIDPVYKKCGVLELFIGDECTSVDIGNGAIRMRSADAPWGPWSPARDVLIAGSPSEPSLQYGPGGLLFHPACKQSNCAQPTRARALHTDEYGFFYAPNIIEQWTRAAGDGVDIYWNVSTWDPYRVALVRTHLTR